MRRHHDRGWTRCSSRAAGDWADGVRDRAGSDVDVRSCCEWCHEVKSCTRHGARQSGFLCAGKNKNLELAPHCAAHDVIPLRSNALIEIGKPGTCCEDRCARHLPGAPPIRPRIHHASRCSTHTPRPTGLSDPVTNVRQTDRTAFMVRGHCQVFLWPPSACRPLQRVSPDGRECATLFCVQAPERGARREGFRQNGVAPRRVDPTSPCHPPHVISGTSCRSRRLPAHGRAR